MCKFITDERIAKKLAKLLLQKMKIDGYYLTGEENDVEKAEIEVRIALV